MSLRRILTGALLLTAMTAAAAWAADVPSKATKFAPTRQRLERGKYLVEGPAHCFYCHSEADYQASPVRIPANKKGAGAMLLDKSLPFLRIPNITPDPETGAGNWSDEQWERALRQGIGHDGRTLFPAMPYHFYREMSDEDLASVVAYVRSIKPLKNRVPRTELPPPVAAALKPLPPAPAPKPDLSTSIKRGEYLVKIGNCASCHTPMDEKGQPMMSLAFAGGFVLDGSWGTVASANITPDPSGISYYDEKTFLRTLRTGKVGARKLNNIMLWSAFRNMTEQDLKDIYAYLRSLPPVKHRVDNTEPPTYCKLCRQKHGAGEQNWSAVLHWRNGSTPAPVAARRLPLYAVPRRR